jgi:fibrillarin-like rRNA methylase
VIRLSHSLRSGGLVVFTLKLPRVDNVDDACAIFRKTVKKAQQAGLLLLAQTHLTYNRHELTLFFERLVD